MQLRIKFEVDEGTRLGRWTRTIQRTSPASRFWSRFNELSTGAYVAREGEKSPKFRYSERGTSGAPKTPSKPSWQSYERKVYENFPVALTFLLKDYLGRFVSVDLEDEDAPESTEASRAIEEFEVRITSMEYGSLEILVFAFGMAKLASLAGISANDVMSYVGALAPSALNMALNTQSPVTAEVSRGGDSTDPLTGSPTATSPQASTLMQQSSPYFFPALLTLGVLGAGAWMNGGISTQLLEERKKLIESLSSAEDRLGQQRAELDKKFLDAYRAHESEMSAERSMIATKMGEFMTSMIESDRRREESAQQASNALATQQLALIREMGTEAGNREAKMFDLIKLPPVPVKQPVPAIQAKGAPKPGG